MTLYVKIADTLRSRIQDGTYKAGGPMPSRTAICEEFGGREAVARAVGILKDEGLITHWPGRRRGYYILRPGETEAPEAHPSRSAYNKGCKCAGCRKVNRDHMAKTLKRLAARPRHEVPHGTTGGYSNWGCRCGKCSAVYLKAQRRHGEARRKKKTE